MTPRKQAGWILTGIVLFAVFLYFTSSLMMTITTTCGLLAAAYLWILVRMGDGWIDANEVEQMRDSDRSRVTARLDRYRLSLAALPEGVILIRSGQSIEWCNPAAEHHLGIKLTKHLGVAIDSVISDKKILQYLSEGDFSKPIKVLSKEPGRELLLSAVVADRTHFIIVTHDVTEQHRIDSMRKDFVANVSHELRTPLTVLSGFLDMILASPEIDEKTIREQLTIMQDESSRMKNLVNDLLALSSLENKDDVASESPEVVSMQRLVAGVAEDGVALSRGRHTITTHIDTDFAILGFVDEIRSACSNLVSNAVRYTPDNGKIDISWHYDKENDTCIYAVKDNGIGIAEKDLPRLTERFYRADKSRSRDTGGTGLGLAIVKHIAIRNHCKLVIESKLGAGSTFSLIFPSEILVR